LADLGRNVRVGRELAQGVAGGERQDRVYDEADDEQRRDRDQEAPGDIAAHLASDTDRIGRRFRIGSYSRRALAGRRWSGAEGVGARLLLTTPRLNALHPLHSPQP